MLSTNAQPEIGTAERKAPGGKKLVTISESILTYNNSMGGIDLVDQMHSYYCQVVVIRLLVAFPNSNGECIPAVQAMSRAGATAADPLAYGIARMPGRKKNCSVCEKVKAHTMKGYGVQTVWGCPVCSVHLCTVSPEPVPTHSPVCQGLL